MNSPSSVPSVCVRDAVAQIAADGALTPASPSMDAWLAQFGSSLEALPLDAEERGDLDAGEPVVMHVADAAWELQRYEAEGQAWLVARDVSDRELRAATVLASVRCRALGKMAASLSHDLNNQFNAVLALSAQLGIYAQSDDDRASLQELEQGTKIGARMAGVLARMLVRTPARRERVAAGVLIEDSLAVVRKTIEHAGIELEVAVPDGLPDVRVAQVEVIQALMEGLHMVIELGPTSVRFEASERPVTCPEGRTRDCVVAVCDANGVDPQLAERVVEVAAVRPGTIGQIASGEGAYDAILAAAFLQRRLGGDLRTSFDDGVLRLEFCWPRVR